MRNKELAARRRAVLPTRLPGRARRRRQFALAQHPERSEWARAFRRGADLAEAGGFGEMFDADYSRHNFCRELDEFYELFFAFSFAQFVTSYPSG